MSFAGRQFAGWPTLGCWSWRPRQVAALVVAAALAVSACGSDDGGDGAARDPSGAAETSGEESAGTGGANDAATITLKLIAFKPAELEVPAGSTVTWRQDDVATHTVTSGRVEQSGGTATALPDGKFDSGNITKGQTFDFTFSEPGDFPFFCAVHPATMTGVVHVK